MTRQDLLPFGTFGFTWLTKDSLKWEIILEYRFLPWMKNCKLRKLSLRFCWYNRELYCFLLFGFMVKALKQVFEENMNLIRTFRWLFTKINIEANIPAKEKLLQKLMVLPQRYLGIRHFLQSVLFTSYMNNGKEESKMNKKEIEKGEIKSESEWVVWTSYFSWRLRC